MSDEPTVTESESDRATPDEIFDVLRAYMVRCGSHEARVILAARLAYEGLTVQRLELICSTYEGWGKEPAETASMIGQTLKTKKEWLVFVEDAEYAAAQKAARGGKRKRSGRRRDTGPTNSPTAAELRTREANDTAYVVARHFDDGVAAADIAKHVRRPVREILAILEAHKGSRKPC